MCGIAGFAGGSSGPDTLGRMTAALAHRGPDAEGFWSGDSAPAVHLGHRRLSILDLAGGAQPMWTADGRIGVVFNGEIYNHADLRAALRERGHRFVTDHSDTEVLLHGWREWGADLLPRLNGMWAFVIYDRDRRVLFGARDRFGKKPLFYHHGPGLFAFGSELGALEAHPEFPRDIDPVALRKYFAYSAIPAPRSIYRAARKLPPGHHFTLDLAGDELQVRRWWEFVPEPEERPVEEWCGALRDALDAAVRRRLISDVPLGVFLSGGIDSSAIAAYAVRHSPRIATFSVGFTDPSFDESAHARRVAGLLGTSHREETLDLEAARAFLPEVVARLDEPMGDPSLLPTWLLARFTRRDVTVALGGDGGDELFAGYDPFRALAPAQRYAALVPRPVHAAIRALAGLLPVSHANLSPDFKIKRTLRGLSHPPRHWNAAWMGPLEPREIADLLGEPIDPEELYSEAVEAWDRNPAADLVERSTQFFVRLYLTDQILVKLDRATMMHGLEGRSPFLDIDLVDLARRIPSSLKLRGGTSKWILKEALAPVLPGDILHRKKKGFGMPVGRWLREGAFPVPVDALPAGLNRGEIRRREAAHRAGKTDDRLFLWAAWLLGSWMSNRP
jgi:asparagine synthase (glutamine-hydrolysing)